MRQKLNSFWNPPVFNDDELTQSAHILHNILRVGISTTLVMAVIFSFSNQQPADKWLSIGVDLFLILSFSAFILWLRRGQVKLIGQTLLILIFLALLPFYFTSDNLSLIAIEYITLIAAAGFLLEVRSITKFGIMCIAAFGVGLFLRAQNFPGILPFSERAIWEGVVILMVMGILLYIFQVALTSLRNNLDRARHSEARYRALLDAIPDLIFRMNSAGMFIDYQANRQQMLFVPPENFLGKSISEVIPTLAEKFYTVTETIFKTGMAQTVEYQLELGDTSRDFEARLIRSGEDEITAIIRDISDRKQAEAERAQQEIRLQTYLSASPIAIYLLDLHTKQSFYFNRASFCGYTKAELETPGSIQFAIHAEDRAMVGNHWAEIATGKAEKITSVYRLQSKTGEWEWVEESKSVTGRDAEGKARELLVTLALITEHKLAEQKIQQLNAELEQRVAERTTQLAASNAALREIERRYQTVIETISEYAYAAYINPAGQPILDWLTPSVEKVTGYTPEAFENHGGWQSILYPEDLPVDEGYHQNLLEGHPISGEVRIITQSGNVRWVRTTARPEIDEIGKVTRILGIVTDITARKQAELALRENEAKLRTLFELLPVGVSVITPDRNIIEMNGALEKMLGIDREGLLRGNYTGRSYLRADGTPMLPHEFASLRALTEQRPVHDVETGVELEDSRVIWTNVNAAPLPDEGVVVVTLDITERKQAEKRRAILYETLHRIGIFLTPEEVMQTAVEAISQLSHWKSVAISMPNPDGKTWKTYAGTGPLIGKFGKDRTMNEGVIGRVYRTGQSQYIPDVTRDPDYFSGEGQPTQTLCEIAVALKHREQILGVLNIESDVSDNFTPDDLKLAESLADAVALSLDNALLYSSLQNELAERKQTEYRLQQANAELARSNADLERFAYAVSHDLQEPLRQVMQFSQLLSRLYRTKLNQDADEMIEFIVEGAGRMNTMVKGLLDYSRLGREIQAFLPTDCNLVLTKAIANLQLRLDEAHGSVTADPLPHVQGNDVLLILLFQNLINNAIKFRSQETPRIHVSAQLATGPTGGHEWTFAIRDNGIGISQEYYERIFIIFQRLHTREEYPGTGIGLALCKRIVELHRGKIWVESMGDEGSTFYFTLPALHED